MGVFINAMGQTIPPVYVYPDTMNTRKLTLIVTNSSTLLPTVAGALEGSVAFFSKKGWMTNEAFVNVLQHFQRYTGASRDNPVLLLMDNHCSHCCYLAIKYVKENGIYLMTFPPHLTNRIQPLDTHMFSPFKDAVKVAEKDFIDMNRTCITISHLAKISTEPYKAVFLNQPEKISKSFSDNGLYPINRLVFSSILFAKDNSNEATSLQNEAANDAESEPLANNIGEDAITISAQPQNNVNADDIPETPLASNSRESGIFIDGTVSGSSRSSGSSLKEALNDIRPLQKSTVKKNVRKSRAKQSTHLTGTPELLKAKEKAEERARREQKKGASNARKYLNFSQAAAKPRGRPKKSVQDRVHMPIEPLTEATAEPPTEVKIGAWIVVKFDDNVRNKKFLGKIVLARKGRFLVKFVRPKATRDYDGYVYEYPIATDKCFIEFPQILRIVDKPKMYRPNRSSLRFNLHCNSLK